MIRKWLSITWIVFLFLLPGLALYVLWMIYPLGYELYISFFDWKIMPGQTSQYVGLDNYRDVLSELPDKLIIRALGHESRGNLSVPAGALARAVVMAIGANEDHDPECASQAVRQVQRRGQPAKQGRT